MPRPEPGRNPGGALQSHRCSNRPALHRRAEFAITGFRNRDLQAKLFDTAPGDDREARRRTHWTSRLIAKLRGHRLITKIGKSRLYRVTARGIKAMWPAIRFRKNDFPIDFQRLASAGC